MALGHYFFRNSDGSTVDIDVDKLPKTTQPPNLKLPNVYIDMPSGRMYRTEVPNFYADPKTGEVFHSTNYGTTVTPQG